MASITTRAGKGSPLTNAELDANFTNINTELGQKLTANQNITVSGDASGSGTTAISLTLANSGVTAGTYGNATNIPQFAVDAKGRITSVSNVAVSIPSGSLTFTGDVTGTGSTGSSTALTLANSGVTAGTYTKVTVDAKGRVTVGALLASADLPTYTGTLTSGQVTTALGFTPYNSTNPSGYQTAGNVNAYFGSPTTAGTLDWNDVTNTKPGAYGTLLLGSATNGPGGGSYYHPFNLEYSSKDGTGNVTQMAVAYGTPGNQLYMRGRYLGTWSSWVHFLNSGNYNSYSPTLTGGGASGTWGISITGNAANVTGTVALANGGSGSTTAAGARTNFGATTVGSNLFTLTNPSAVTFLRVNADNTVSALDAATFRSAIGAGTSSTTGTVTSVSGTGTVSGLTLTGTVTGSGSLTLGGAITGFLPSTGGALTGNLTLSGTGLRLIGDFTNATVSSRLLAQTSTANSATFFGVIPNGTATNAQLQVFNSSSPDNSSFGALIVNANQVRITSAALGTGTQLPIAFHIGATQVGIFETDGTFKVGSNVALHAGNYTSYSPSLTGSGASGTWGISISGNAATATSADQIDGVGFRNTGSNSAVAADSLDSNGITYVASNISLLGQTDGALYSQAYNSSWQHQIYGDYRTGQIAVRGKNSNAWQAWRTVLDSSNYTSYAPSLSGNYKNISVGGLYSRYNYNESAWITDSTSAYSLSPDFGQTTVAMHNSHGFFGNWATTLTMSGYERYGAYQISGNYNASTPDLAMRNYNQSIGGWTSWTRLLSSANYSQYALPLSGGTMTGRTFVSVNGRTTAYTGSNFEVTTTDNTPPGISFHRGGYSATLLYESDGELFVNAWISRAQNGKLLSSGNYSGYALPLSGGTVSGNVYLSANAQGVGASSTLRVNGDITAARGNGTTGVIYLGNSGSTYVYWDGVQYHMPSGQLDVGGNRVLTAGNYTSYAPSLTGAGASGTWGINITGSANTLDGYDSTEFGSEYWRNVTVGGDANTYYPVVFVNSYQDWSLYLRKQVHDYATWDGTLTAEIEYHSSTWGGDAGYVQLRRLLQNQANKFLANWGQSAGPNSFAIVWLRGGGRTYQWRASRLLSAPSIYYTTTDLGNSNGSVGPTTSLTTTAQITPITTYNASSELVGGNTFLHSGNFTSYSPGLTGSGASGTWGISITGNAANVTGTVSAANGGTGRTSLTANNVVLGNGTSAVNFVAPGTAGNVLTSDGTTWVSSAAAGSGGGGSAFSAF